MKVTIVGAGAMGCVFGARLASADATVRFVDVNESHIEAINHNGLECALDEGRFTLPLSASTASNAHGQSDLIIVFTKSAHTEAAIASVKHLIGDETYVLTLQNGLGAVEKIARFAPRGRILHGVTTVPAELLGPGKVESKGKGKTQFYAVTGAPAVLSAIEQLFNKAGLETVADEDIEKAIWTKVIFNAAMNATCALLDTTPGPLGDTQAGRDLAESLVEEGVAVARAIGVDVDAASVHAMTTMSMTKHRNHQPSMLQDLMAGRQTEIDDINGAVMRAGREAGVNTPVNETIYRLIKIREAL